MDNKLLLIFILLFLSFLLLFYYLKLKSNIIMLLSIIIVLCINKLIVQKEYFEEIKLTFKEAQDVEGGYRQRDLIDYILNFGKKKNKPHSIKYDFIGSTPHLLTNINKDTSEDNKTNKTWKKILSNMKSELLPRPVIPYKSIPKYDFIGSTPLVKLTISQVD
jgi:hypothetical protein